MMSGDVTQLEKLFHQWGRLQAVAMTGQMEAAAHLMAERARTAVPGAAVLVLEDSDQGDWLTLTKVEDATGGLLAADVLEIDQGAASCIYQDVASAVVGIEVRHGGSRAQPREYLLSIGLTSPPAPPIEVIVVRDPDASNEVWVLMGGEILTDEVSEVCVDAGAGWLREDWEEFRADALRDASPAATGILTAVLDDPPGARYIIDFEAGQ